MAQKPAGVLIVDDEFLARRIVREFLAPHADLIILGECENGLEALERISALAPDLVFLDVQMPGINGIEVLEASGRRGGVIFTTAHDEFALRAFDFHAVDYLLKPFSRERFDAALDRARQARASAQASLGRLVAAETERLHRLLVPVRGRVEVVPVEQIDYIEAQDDYIAIHTQGRALLKNQSLADLEAQLDPQGFLRIHRSYLVNIARLKAVERTGKDTLVACLSDGTRLPISRRGHERIRAVLLAS
ncbi:MAG: response regulator transcription factor [Betaproteobacteria bacterium]|nr:response regulator transcription factor [Betaproteobacteria bacterium]